MSTLTPIRCGSAPPSTPLTPFLSDASPLSAASVPLSPPHILFSSFAGRDEAVVAVKRHSNFTSGATSSTTAEGEGREDGSVSNWPLCILRLRGPGRARRAPPGTAYRSAGASLRRVLRYNEDGAAQVQVVREKGCSAGAAAVSADDGHTVDRAGAAVSSFKAEETAAAVVARTESTAPTSSPPPNAGVTQPAGTGSQRWRDNVAALALESERACIAEHEQMLSSLLCTLPLLRVIPPQSLLQQAYTDNHEAHGWQSREAGVVLASTSGGSRLAATSMGALPRGSSSVLQPLRQLDSRGVKEEGDSGSSCDRRTTHAARAPLRTVIRGGNGLGLNSVILLTPEETAEMQGTSLPNSESRGAAEEGGAGLQEEPTSCIEDFMKHQEVPARPSWRSNVSEDSASIAEAAGLSAATPFRNFAATGGGSATAAAAAAVVAMLSSTFVDGELGVVIRIGASCEESKSLRSLVWGGCRPPLLRAVVWRLLSDYAPAVVRRQRAELQRKRLQYDRYTRQYCSALPSVSLQEESCTAFTKGSSSSPLLRLHAHVGSGKASGGGAASQGSSLSRLPATLISNSLSSVPSLNRSGHSAGGSTGYPATSLPPHEQTILNQMLLDLPRHRSPVFHASRAVAGMTRCLFLWAQRHPAVGYVQGMDDVLSVFYQVFLADALRQVAREESEKHEGGAGTHSNMNSPSCERSGKGCATAITAASDGGKARAASAAAEGGLEVMPRVDGQSTRAVLHLLVASLAARASTLSPDTPEYAAATTPATPPVISTSPTKTVLSPYFSETDLETLFQSGDALDAVLARLPERYVTQVEADTYWCADRILSLLQDNFTLGQPGITKNVRRLAILIHKVDPSLVEFLDSYGLTVMDGCFQWLHCLLAREFPIALVLRLWDCYLAIGTGGAAALSSSHEPANGHRPTSSGASPSAGSSASDEAIMCFHVCVCCALLRSVRDRLVAAHHPRQTASAGAASYFGWPAATTLASMLPGLRTRIPQRSDRGEGSSSTSLLFAGTPMGGRDASHMPPMDVVMTALKRPFEALFPHYASNRQGAPPHHITAAAAPTDMRAGRPDTPDDASASSEAAAMRWLDVLIADAYCIWRLHCLNRPALPG